jgi:hypothetical protein
MSDMVVYQIDFSTTETMYLKSGNTKIKDEEKDFNNPTFVVWNRSSARGLSEDQLIGFFNHRKWLKNQSHFIGARKPTQQLINQRDNFLTSGFDIPPPFFTDELLREFAGFKDTDLKYYNKTRFFQQRIEEIQRRKKAEDIANANAIARAHALLESSKVPAFSSASVVEQAEGEQGSGSQESTTDSLDEPKRLASEAQEAFGIALVAESAYKDAFATYNKNSRYLAFMRSKLAKRDALLSARQEMHQQLKMVAPVVLPTDFTYPVLPMSAVVNAVVVPDVPVVPTDSDVAKSE